MTKMLSYYMAESLSVRIGVNETKNTTKASKYVYLLTNFNQN